MPPPCDGHGGPIKGRYVLGYPALLSDGQRYFRRTAYCPECLMELIGRHRKEWLIGGGLAVTGVEAACHCCGSQPEHEYDLKRFFFTAYPKKDQRVDYESYYCANCAELVRNEFRLEATNGRE